MNCEKSREIKAIQTGDYIIWFPWNASSFVSIVVCFSVSYQQGESPPMQVVFVIQNKDEKTKETICLSMRSKHRYLPAGFQSSKWT